MALHQRNLSQYGLRRFLCKMGQMGPGYHEFHRVRSAIHALHSGLFQVKPGSERLWQARRGDVCLYQAAYSRLQTDLGGAGECIVASLSAGQGKQEAEEVEEVER